MRLRYELPALKEVFEDYFLMAVHLTGIWLWGRTPVANRDKHDNPQRQEE